jgi:hypothetical protein
VFRKEIRELIWALILLSFGGLLLHLRIHPPSESLFYWIPFLFALMNTLVIPFLFNRRETVAYAYLFTWATVIAGTVGMAYFSITTWNLPVTAISVILKSMLPDIIMLWSKIFLAHKILRFHWPDGVTTKWEGGCTE